MSSSFDPGIDDHVRKKPLTPTPTQEEFLQDTQKQVLMSGSFGAGKSRIGCEKGYMLNLKYSGNRGLIVRNTFTDVWSSTVDQTLLEEVIPESHIANHNQTKHKITHFSGARGPDGEPVTSEIQYHGLDASGTEDGLPTKIGGQQYGWIFVDEGIEIDKSAWIQLLGRLRYTGREENGRRYQVPFRQIFTATNPASKAHWMYQWFFNSDKGDTEIYRMTAHELADNVPTVPNDYVTTMEANFTGMYADRYIHGEWVTASGLVYNEYEPEIHYRPVEDLPGEWEVEARIDHGETETVLAMPPDGWRIYRAIDFGYRNPFVCQWWARDPETDTHVLFREIYKTERLMEDLAVEIKRLSEGMRIEQSFADPAQAEDRATLRRHGVETVEAKKDVSAGIQEVKSKLNTADDGPKLMFMSGALAHSLDENLDNEGAPVKTVDEIRDYQWKDNKDAPEKEDDHGMDTLRYYVHTVSQGSTWTQEEMERLESMFNDDGGF